MKKYYADKRSLSILRVLLVFILIVLVIVIKYIMYRLELMFSEHFASEYAIAELVVWAVVITSSVIYLLYIFVYLPIQYNSIQYCVSESEVIAKSGVFFKSTTYMKCSSVQYVTKISTPLSKYTGLNFVVLSAHGGMLALTFLSQSDADEICELIGKSIMKHRRTNIKKVGTEKKSADKNEELPS